MYVFLQINKCLLSHTCARKYTRVRTLLYNRRVSRSFVRLKRSFNSNKQIFVLVYFSIFYIFVCFHTCFRFLFHSVKCVLLFISIFHFIFIVRHSRHNTHQSICLYVYMCACLESQFAISIILI